LNFTVFLYNYHSYITKERALAQVLYRVYKFLACQTDISGVLTTLEKLVFTSWYRFYPSG